MVHRGIGKDINPFVAPALFDFFFYSVVERKKPCRLPPAQSVQPLKQVPDRRVTCGISKQYDDVSVEKFSKENA